MGKAPAFQFYVRDWLSDPELRMASASSRGIWIDCLAYMWEARQRGMLVFHRDNLHRLVGCTKSEADLFLHEATTLNFADVTFCNSDVTLVNRRMLRDEKHRANTRLRVQRYRSNVPCNDDVTPPSSSSSSSSKKKRVCPFDMGTFTFFWTSYPRKVSKEEAKKAWAKLKPNAGLIEQIVEDVKRRTKFDPDWLEEGGKFIPYPATYLNRKRWEDEQTQLPDPHGWAKNPDGTWKREEEL